MRILIETKNECLLLDVANIAMIKTPRRDVKSPCMEISCTNHEVYRISCLPAAENGSDKFVAYCTKAINTIYDARRQGQHSFALSFEETLSHSRDFSHELESVYIV